MTTAEIGQRFRIPDEMLATAGVRDASDAEARDLLGIHGYSGCDLSGVVFPYRHPLTGAAVGHRLRLGRPLAEPKYLMEQGCRSLFVAPAPKDWITDVTVPVVLVEAEKSALALMALAERDGRKLVAIATGGCWGWKRNAGKRDLPDGGGEPVTAPSPTVELLNLQAREATIVFDSNANVKPEVRAARRALAAELEGRGAQVKIAEVPLLAGVNGPDDLVAVSGDDATLAMLDTAVPWAAAARAAAEGFCDELVGLAGAAKKKADPALFVRAAAAVQDGPLRDLLIGRVAAARLPGFTRSSLERQVAVARGAAESERKAAAEAARRGRLLSENVAGAALLNGIGGVLRKFHRHTANQNVALALAVLHSWCYTAFAYAPIVHITGPAKRCGKSLLMDLLKLLVWLPWKTASTSKASLVSRCARGCTLLLDEVDQALKGEKEFVAALVAALNSRYETGNPASIMVPGKDGAWESKDFDLFGPTVIGGIGALPDTVADRSIPIALKRKSRSESTERFRKLGVQAEFGDLADGCAAWAAQHTDALRAAHPELPEALNDRQQDICEPLLAIADLAGGEWPELARKALVELCAGEAAEDDNIGARLLGDVRRIFFPKDDEGNALPPLGRIASKDLAEALGGIETSPWPEWKNGKPLTPPQLARQLGKFGISPRNFRQSGGSVLKGYAITDFTDAWARYLTPDRGPGEPPSPPATDSNRYTATTRVNKGESGDFASATGNPCSGTENTVSANEYGHCSGVAVSTAGNGGGANVAAAAEAPSADKTGVRAPSQSGLFGTGWQEAEL